MKKFSKIQYLTTLSLFSALVLLMNFTNIGFLRFGAISVTLLPIPVAVGAIFLGPLAGGILGGVFGLASFYQCFAGDILGTLLVGISPISTFVMCFVPRVLMGLCAGWLHRGLSAVKSKRLPLWAAITTGGLLGCAATAILLFAVEVEKTWQVLLVFLGAALVSILIGFTYHFIVSLRPEAAPSVLSSGAGAIFNTLFFVSALVLLFGRNPDVLAAFGTEKVKDVIFTLVTFNAVIEVAVCLLVGTALSRVLFALKAWQGKSQAANTDKTAGT